MPSLSLRSGKRPKKTEVSDTPAGKMWTTL